MKMDQIKWKQCSRNYNFIFNLKLHRKLVNPTYPKHMNPRTMQLIQKPESRTASEPRQVSKLIHFKDSESKPSGSKLGNL